MAAKTKDTYTELTCFLCSYPLTSYKSVLTDEVLSLISDPKTFKRPNQADPTDLNRIAAIDKEQIVATKCGHMFHIFCLRTFIKTGIEKKGAAFCPICTKPVTLARIWPVLIPPTANQVTRFQKLCDMKEQNSRLKDELKELRLKIQESTSKLKKTQDEITECIEDIQEKQRTLEQLAIPSEEDLEELRKIHSKRQMIVKIVTKHNADLLELLMRETNVQVSEAEIALECPELEQISNKKRSKKSKAHCNRYSVDEASLSLEETPSNLMALPSSDYSIENKICSSFNHVNNNVHDIHQQNSKSSPNKPSPRVNLLAQQKETMRLPNERPRSRAPKNPNNRKLSQSPSEKKSTKSSVSARRTVDGPIKGTPRSKVAETNYNITKKQVVSKRDRKQLFNNS